MIASASSNQREADTAPDAQFDTGLKTLLMMASMHGVAADEAQLRHEFGHELFTIQTVLLAAKSDVPLAKYIRPVAKRKIPSLL
jgi:subfamily B ATP-binding cassette protein HlyB/CyaB